MNESALHPPADQDQSGHLSASDVAGFIDHDLDLAERRRIEIHLEHCAACRAELIESQQVVAGFAAPRTTGSTRSYRRWWPAAVAAGLGVLLLLPRRSVDTLVTPDTTRAAPVVDGEGTPRIAIVAPAEDADVTAGAVALTWRATAADLYRVTVVTESGDPVWNDEIADTTVRPPAALLRTGERYFWRVDAIANGITATTGVHRLRISP